MRARVFLARTAEVREPLEDDWTALCCVQREARRGREVAASSERGNGKTRRSRRSSGISRDAETVGAIKHTHHAVEHATAAQAEFPPLRADPVILAGNGTPCFQGDRKRYNHVSSAGMLGTSTRVVHRGSNLPGGGRGSLQRHDRLSSQELRESDRTGSDDGACYRAVLVDLDGRRRLVLRARRVRQFPRTAARLAGTRETQS